VLTYVSEKKANKDGRVQTAMQLIKACYKGWCVTASKTFIYKEFQLRASKISVN